MFGYTNPFSSFEDEEEDIDALKAQIKTLQAQLDMTLESKALDKNPILIFRFSEEIDRAELENIAKGLGKVWKSYSGSEHVIFIPETSGELSSLSDADLELLGLKRIRAITDRDDYDRMLQI